MLDAAAPPSPGATARDAPVWAVIDLDAISANWAAVRAAAPTAQVLAVVKANAYGHGLTPVAQHLARLGVAGFGVARSQEGLALRAAGIRAPVLVLGGVEAGMQEAAAAQLTPVVHRLGQLRPWAEACAGRPFCVHLKLDTGMARLGLSPAQLPAFVAELASVPQARVSGVMSHLADAAGDAAFTVVQRERFEAGLAQLRQHGIAGGIRHLANSAGLWHSPDLHYDWVRPGIALYGYAPGVAHPPKLRPAMSLYSKVVALRTLERGESVGYGRQHRCQRPTRVATLGVGYGDGWLWSATGPRHVSIRGQRCPLLGQVCMDLCSADVSHLPAVEVGDPVLCWGHDGADLLSVEVTAAAAHSSVWAQLTALSARVPRRYLGGVPK
ncbi:MAG: alanine racemase [Polyangiales bacterium]